MPGEIRIDRLALTVLRADLGGALPLEGCGLLLGLRDGPLWRIRRIWPCRNIWEPAAERPRRFAIDPREQLLAQRWARQHGWQVLGSAHSHPSSEPVPSAIDCQLAFAPTLMLILGLAAAPEQELTAWWLEGEAQPGSPYRRLGWRMED
ncbi:MAG: M67 family metallopeptidase [Cyanobacteria bacterium]|nr:M67 family metallopeptidase [Cyanobacteriota bacterium]